MGQLVLVFEAELLNRLGHFEGCSLKVEPYLSTLLDPANNRFMERDLAERDPRYKQIIPYVILRYRDTLFSYVRGKGSSESRLIASRSIGLGGHIEPSDQSLFASDRDLYVKAARREVDEEVQIETTWIERIIGLVNDESTEVGKVHFGIVHLWDVAEPRVMKREHLITKAGFVPIATLENNSAQLETWSRLALEMVGISGAPTCGVGVGRLASPGGAIT